MAKMTSTLSAMILATVLFVCSSAQAGLDACSLIKTEEVSQIMGTPMKGSPIIDDRCYFLGEGHELTVVVLDKARYDQAKGSPILTKMGMKIQPLPGVSPESIQIDHPGIAGHDIYFAKGTNAVILQIKTGKGEAGDFAAAEAIGKLIVPRMP